MKIAFIVSEFPIISETFILNQIVGLIERGHEVDIYASERGNINKVHPSVKQYNLLKSTYYFTPIPDQLLVRLIQGLGLIVRYLFKQPGQTLKSLNFLKYGNQAFSLWLLYTIMPSLGKTYEIIHCQFGHQCFRAMAFQTMNHPEAKLITIFRGHDISSFIQQKGNHVYDQLFKTGDFFLANCDFFRRRVIELGCNPNKIKVHRSGLDCRRFLFQQRHFPKDGCIQIATTGRLVEKKGIEYAIKAVVKQAKETPNLIFKIIGDGELRHELQNLINQLNATHFIEILGWKNENEIREILDQSHIFVAPSVTAKDGNQDAPINVLKEAMAMGLPVISTYHGGIPELVEDGISGFLVPERDSDAIALKLDFLIQHPEEWSKMGKAGRNFVESYYNLEQLNDQLVDIYHQLLQPTLATIKLEQMN